MEVGGVEDVGGIPQACQENRLASGMQEKDMTRKQERNLSRFEKHRGISKYSKNFSPCISVIMI